MATVYLARLDATGGFAREFALKVVHPHLAAEKGFRQRFYREARLASRVRHQNVVATIDAGEDRGYCYLALELIEGATLRQIMLHRDRPFAAIEAAFIVSEVARGLHALHTSTDADGHELQILHRDLSPHNVMLDHRGRSVLIDLGLAKSDTNADMTQVGVLCGKLPYMSPEQARVESMDARSDIFSLGTVLYELCTGTLPFGDTHTTATLERLQRCDAAEITERLQLEAVPRGLIEIIVGCLRPDPDDRFTTALELVDALTQEIVRTGHSAAEIKARLATITRDALPEIGVATPLEAMAPALGAEPVGRSLRFMGLGALAVLIVFGGFFIAAKMLPTRGTKSVEEPILFEASSLAPEPVPPKATAEEPRPGEPPQGLETVPAPDSALVTMPPEGETDGMLEAETETESEGSDFAPAVAPRRIRRKTKARTKGSSLREHNPYER